MKNRVPDSTAVVAKKSKPHHLKTTVTVAEADALRKIAEKKGVTIEELMREAADDYLKSEKTTYEICLMANDWSGDGDFIATSALSRADFSRLMAEADARDISVGRFLGEIIQKAVSYPTSEKILDLVFADQEDAS